MDELSEQDQQFMHMLALYAVRYPEPPTYYNSDPDRPGFISEADAALIRERLYGMAVGYYMALDNKTQHDAETLIPVLVDSLRKQFKDFNGV